VLNAAQCDEILQHDYPLFTDPARENKAVMSLLHEFHRNETKDPNNVLMHCLGHWRCTERFHDLCWLPSITVPASQLVDTNRRGAALLRLFHDQLFAKPPLLGGNVAWHQDYSYWTRTAPMAHITVHIALDPQTVDNGCIRYVPGSHRWHRNGQPLPITDRHFVNMDSIQNALNDDEKRQFKPVDILLKKGEAAFHHPLMVHGSLANKSTGTRNAAVVNYLMDGVYANHEASLGRVAVLDGCPPLARGEPLRGQFWPIVFEPQWLQKDRKP